MSRTADAAPYIPKHDVRARKDRRQRERAEREWHRAYGSDCRVRYVRALPCVFCGATPSVNAHIKTGGKGRKADARYIVPACADCHHQMDHGMGKAAMEQAYNVDLEAEAARIDREFNLEF